MIAFSRESQKKNPLKNKHTNITEFDWPKMFIDLNLNGMARTLLRQASASQEGEKVRLSFPESVLSILNEDQKKDIEKSFNDFLKKQSMFI